VFYRFVAVVCQVIVTLFGGLTCCSHHLEKSSTARFHQPKPEISHLLQHTEYYEGLFFCILPEFSVHLILIIADLLFLHSFLFIFLFFDCPLFATHSIFVRLFRSGKKYLTLGSPPPPVPRLFSPPRPEAPNDKRASQHLKMEQVKQKWMIYNFSSVCLVEISPRRDHPI